MLEQIRSCLEGSLVHNFKAHLASAFSMSRYSISDTTVTVDAMDDDVDDTEPPEFQLFLNIFLSRAEP